MKKRKVIICFVSLIAFACLCVLAALMIRCINSAGDDAALRWTMIGAFGSWAGSIFGAFALIISLFALWLPQKVKLKVAVSTGMMVSQMPGVERIDAYIITVKNIGVRPITVNNVYLHFGNKKNGDIFVGMLNQGTLLQAYTISFPKRLDQGESFDYYLLKDKLDIALAYYEENTPLKTPLSIRVSEVTRGDRYFKTPWTLEHLLVIRNEIMIVFIGCQCVTAFKLCYRFQPEKNHHVLSGILTMQRAIEVQRTIM